MAEPDGAAPVQPTWAEYPRWLEGKTSQKDVASASVRFELVSQKIRSEIETSDFWAKFVGAFDEWDDEYTARCRYKLFVNPSPPPVVIKPYDSLLDKSYRKNVVSNQSWPSSPDQGWVTPLNWYERVNDIVRTTVVVKYLDGVEFFVERAQSVAEQCGRPFSVDYEAREEGYYAAHCYARFEIDIPTLSWATEATTVRFEIQVTTQLQDVIRNLTHDYYELRRSSNASPNVKWQWDYKGPEFVPNYLGHILHYVEGMIMEVRMRGDA